jgi:hypothetical protein
MKVEFLTEVEALATEVVEDSEVCINKRIMKMLNENKF